MSCVSFEVVVICQNWFLTSQLTLVVTPDTIVFEEVRTSGTTGTPVVLTSMHFVVWSTWQRLWGAVHAYRSRFGHITSVLNRLNSSSHDFVNTYSRCKQWCAEFSCWRPRASCRSSASFRVSQRASSSHLLKSQFDKHLSPRTT